LREKRLTFGNATKVPRDQSAISSYVLTDSEKTALSIWVAYTYLIPMASVGAGCYVPWQNIVKSIELWEFRRKSAHTEI
jgi:hypothetical protein